MSEAPTEWPYWRVLFAAGALTVFGQAAVAMPRASAVPLQIKTDAIDPSDAKLHVGELKTVCGPVASIHADPNAPMRLGLGRDSADVSLTVEIGGDALRRVHPTFVSRARSLMICVFGWITQQPGRLELRVTDWMRLRGWEIPRSEADFGKGIFRFDAGIALPTGLVPPKVLRRVRPNYSDSAMRAKIQGDVEVEGVLDEHGSISDVRFVRSLDALFGLDDEAVKAFKKWSFQPATLNGIPTPVVITGILQFRLH